MHVCCLWGHRFWGYSHRTPLRSPPPARVAPTMTPRLRLRGRFHSSDSRHSDLALVAVFVLRACLRRSISRWTDWRCIVRNPPVSNSSSSVAVVTSGTQTLSRGANQVSTGSSPGGQHPMRVHALTSPTLGAPSAEEGATAQVDAPHHGRRPHDKRARLLRDPPPCLRPNGYGKQATHDWSSCLRAAIALSLPSQSLCLSSLLSSLLCLLVQPLSPSAVAA